MFVCISRLIACPLRWLPTKTITKFHPQNPPSYNRSIRVFVCICDGGHSWTKHDSSVYLIDFANSIWAYTATHAHTQTHEPLSMPTNIQPEKYDQNEEAFWMSADCCWFWTANKRWQMMCPFALHSWKCAWFSIKWIELKRNVIGVARLWRVISLYICLWRCNSSAFCYWIFAFCFKFVTDLEN